MSAETSNLSHIQDEDVLRKMWQDTDDFGKKKEIRSLMYKLREQRLREFYNGSEITDSRSTCTTGKVTESSTHADSLVDQSFQSFKSKEVRDSESPTRDIHYKEPGQINTSEWQVSSNNEKTPDGKTRIQSIVSTAQGTQKIDGGKIDFKSKNEKFSSVYQDKNENSETNRSQSCSQSSTSTRMVSTSNAHELPNNVHGITKVIRETKTLPDDSTVLTTRHDSTNDASQFTNQTEQISSSSRQFQEKKSSNTISSEYHPNEIPTNHQGFTKVTKETKTLPDGSTITLTKYDTVGSPVQNTQTGHFSTAHTSSSNRIISEKQSSINIGNQSEIQSNFQGATKINKDVKIIQDDSTNTSVKYNTIKDSENVNTSSSKRVTQMKESLDTEIPKNLQGVTKVTKETKTLPDGSIVTTTKYDTATGTTTHTEITGNVKLSKHHSSIDNKSTRLSEEVVTTENLQNYKQKEVANKRKNSQTSITDNKTTVISEKNQNINNRNTTILKGHLINEENVNKKSENFTSHRVTDEDIPNKQPVDMRTENITTSKQDHNQKIQTDNFIKVEQQQEVQIKGKRTPEATLIKAKESPRTQEPEIKSPIKPTQSEYQRSRPTDGQYETTYRTDFANKKISVEVSPTHDAFARSLRSVSPDRISNKGGHRISNSSLPDKTRHPSRVSPDRLLKNRSGSPTKSTDRFSSTDTYIYNKRKTSDDSIKKSTSPKRKSSTDKFEKTVSQETITVSTTSKYDTSNKTSTIKERKTSNQSLPISRSPSPSKSKDYLRKLNDIVTDLDEDTNITIERRKTSVGSRPTSLELVRKPKKVTDRSPSSPLTDMGSPKKSPVKEIKRSHSFKSPSKEPPSPTKYPTHTFKTPVETTPKSPIKDKPSKNLPEDRPLKRTDTYEERCRQILGITEVTDKRKSSLDRSLSKRNSFRKNASSHNVDKNESPTSPSKATIKGTPLDSPVKEGPNYEIDLQNTTVVKETKTFTSKQDVIERRSSKEEPIKPRTSSPTKIDKSPVKENHIPFDVENIQNSSQESKITKNVLKKSSKNTNEINILENNFNQTTNSNDNNIPSKKQEKEPFKKTSVTEYPSQNKPLTEDNQNNVIKIDKTECVSQENTFKEATINIQEKEIINEVVNTSKLDKNVPKDEKPYKQIFSPTKDSQNLVTGKNKTATTEFIAQEKTHTDIHSSTEAIVDESEIVNTPRRKITKTLSADESTPILKTKINKNVSKGTLFLSREINTKDEKDLEIEKTKQTSKNTKTTNNKPTTKLPTEHSRKVSSPTELGTKNIITEHNEFITNVNEPVTNEIVTVNTKTTVSEFPSQIRKEPIPDKSTKKIVQETLYTTELIDSDEIKTSGYKSNKLNAVDDENISAKYTALDKSPMKEVTNITITEDITNLNSQKLITDEIITTTNNDNLNKKTIKSISPTKEVAKKVITEFPSQIRKESNKTVDKPLKQSPSRNDSVPTLKSPKKNIDKPENRQNNFKIHKENVNDENTTSTVEDTIIDELIVVDNSNIPKITVGKPIPKSKPVKKVSELPIKTKPSTTEDITNRNKVSTIKIATSKDSTTKDNYVDCFVVTDEFEILNNLKQKPLPTDKKSNVKEPKIVESKQSTIKNNLHEKEHPAKQKSPKGRPQLTEFPSQIKKHKQPIKETSAVEKRIEPISYENKIPVEEPLMTKKFIYSSCREDEVQKSKALFDHEKTTVNNENERAVQTLTTTTKNSTSPKKVYKRPTVNQQVKKLEKPSQKKPNQTEYQDQYSKPKPTDNIRVLQNRPKNVNETEKLPNRNNFASTKPVTRVSVNGIHKTDKIKDNPEAVKTSSVIVNTIKSKQIKTDTLTKKSTKSLTLKENESPDQKPKRVVSTDKMTKSPVKVPSTGTRSKPSQPDLTTKKHLVTTSITLKSDNQSTAIKPKATNTIKPEINRITVVKQKHTNEYVLTDTEEDELIDKNRTEIIEVTKRTVSKKPEKKCVTTKTVIINNNNTDQRQIIVDLQRSKSSREPTPDKICPVPTNNGGYEPPRYPDEIVEPDDDVVHKKPKRLFDIPLNESEDVIDFNRITEIIDTKVIHDVDKVEQTDESLLSVNKKINLFSDTADKLTKGNNKQFGPAPKVIRPKLEVTEELKSDECLLSVSEKVNKFVNAADQFINVHDVPERPRSPRCKFNNEKITSNNFITTEKQTLENQNTTLNTGKISLENLNIENNTKSVYKKSTTIISPEDTELLSSTTNIIDKLDIINKTQNRSKSPVKSTSTDFVKIDNLDKVKKSYPNYNTITKRVSLENLETQSSLKTTNAITKNLPENNSPSKLYRERETSPEDKKYKHVVKASAGKNSSTKFIPDRRPSNEHSSVNNIKTQVKKSSNRDTSPKTDTTPKSSKSNIEDKRAILSTTSRLRSTESIKKARALFENIAKDQDQVRSSNNSPVYNKHQQRTVKKAAVPRKLSYSSEDDSKLPNNSRSRSSSPTSSRNISPTKHAFGVPHYMLPLDKNNHTNKLFSKSPDSSKSISPNRHSGSSDFPHYMLPLDRENTVKDMERGSSKASSPDRQSDKPDKHISRSDVKSKTNDDVPHYMLPLDQSVHPHDLLKYNIISDTTRSRSSLHDVQPETGDVPHYMLPLDRSVHPHDLHKENITSDTTRSRSSLHDVQPETGDVPHYMLPLDRSVHPHDLHKENIISDTTRSRSSLHDVQPETSDVPHYMLPLDRSVHPHDLHKENIISDTTRSRSSLHDVQPETGDVPHYMLPLDRSVHPHDLLKYNIISDTTRSRSSLHDVQPETGDVPHYMLPLDRSVHPHDLHKENITSDTTRFRSSLHDVQPETGDVPHYMLPLDRSVHPHDLHKENIISDTTRSRSSLHDVQPETGYVPHYMLPLDKSVHPHDFHKENITSDTTRSRSSLHDVQPETGDVPHYMLPLDRSVHPHDLHKVNIISDTTRSRLSLHDVQPETSDVPHYMLPLDRSVHPHDLHKENITSDTTRSRSSLHDVQLETGDVPHYMLPLDKSVHPHDFHKENITSDTTRSRSSLHDVQPETGDVPHYMLPLDRSVHPHDLHKENITSDTTRSRSSLHDVQLETGDVPHYMLPLDRSVHPHDLYKENITTDTTRSRSSLHDVLPETGDVPHYMLPLDRSVYPHDLHKENIPSDTTRSRSSLHDVLPETGDVLHYMLPLDRSVHPPDIHKENILIDTTRSRPSLLDVQPKTGDVPHYMLQLDRSVHPHDLYKKNITSDTTRSRSSLHDVESETGDVPHYMLPLDRRVQPDSQHKDNLTQDVKIDTSTTKFGVTLKKINQENTFKTVQTGLTTNIKSPIKNVAMLTEENIQDIFELEILEQLLHTVTSYELRRVIRTQIRLVKKLISENTLTIHIKNRRQSKTKKDQLDSSTQKSSEYYSSQTRTDRRRSSENITETKTRNPQRIQSPNAEKTKKTTSQRTSSPNKSFSENTVIKTEETRKSSPERTTKKVTTTTTTTKYNPTRQQSPQGHSNVHRTDNTIISNRQDTYTITSSSERRTSRDQARKCEEYRNVSPERTIKKSTISEVSSTTGHVRRSSKDSTSIRTTKTYHTSPEKNESQRKENRRESPDKNTLKPETRSNFTILKKTEVTQKNIEDNKPDWVTKRNLKKVSPNTFNEKISTSSRKTVKKEKVVEPTERQPTDLITSSYGVGPIDANGTPLFGLKALRTQNNVNGTTKVQGTFIKSEYYSENGNDPVGQISVTKYSTDPRDLSTDEQIENNELVASVTTTQKFGYENTPSLEALKIKKVNKQIEDSVARSDRTSSFKRKNSVKALSQKFIDTAVESLKSERQTSYPKAGLILRTSSFKDSKNDSNEEDNTTDVITTSTTSKQTTMKTTSGGTFLSNKSTISGVSDVINRMKTEEYQEGDSSEDVEARSLLNKFLGSQVILSGIESRGSSVTTSKTSTSDVGSVPASTTVRKTIKITSTAVEDGKSKSKTLIFQSPITEEELENIWDEQTLRLLLEQSTDYEERRLTRNRLRKVMAEQEACAELVGNASQEQSSGSIDEKESIEKTTTESPTTTTTKVTKITTQQQIAKKPLSPFAKFRQLDKQNSFNTPPSTPGTPKSPGNGPLFKFTDPAVSQSAATIKDRLLFWCKMKTKEYENVQLDNFSTSWADGLAFCALIHHFLPDAFDFHALTPKERRHNFELAFRVASEKADIFPLLDVDDMMATRKPDWKCVFTYVQSIYRRFKDEEI